MKHLYTKLFLVIFIFGSHFLFSQKDFSKFKFDTTKTYVIDLQDETRFIAKVTKWNSESIFIQTPSLPLVKISLKQITKIEEVLPENLKEGKYWFKNPHSTRYLFAPSAHNLKKGEGYYQNAWLILNSFNVGITDYFSFGGGIELISTFSRGKPIFFLTPKVGFEVSKKVNLGGGILYASIPEDDNRMNFGIGYGIATYGSLDHNFTVGLGWGYFNDEFSKKPIIVFSGMTRVGKKWSLITENWIGPVVDDEYRGIYSYGLRFFGEKIAVDLVHCAKNIHTYLLVLFYLYFVEEPRK